MQRFNITKKQVTNIECTFFHKGEQEEMNPKIKVLVTGASGRMGQEVVKLVLSSPDLELVAGVDLHGSDQDLGLLVGKEACGVKITADLAAALKSSKADVMVDFTAHHTAVKNTKLAIEHHVRPVIGTSGFTPEDINMLNEISQQKQIGGAIIPNFSIAAVLMMQFAAQAAKYYPHLEIIEYHGDQKLDAPSGTAMKTAELIAEKRDPINQGNPQETESLAGARGGLYKGFRIHSVRLPGIFAQQEVVMAAFGESLKIRHDSYDRASYMPGVHLCIQKVMTVQGIVYGLEHFME
jgi:4-hydroxy-tetrahydrodipicolinate reductase